jgi:predicted RecB family nuclease
MRFSDLDISHLFRPSRCERRVFLLAQADVGKPESPFSFDSTLREADLHIERQHRKHFAEYLDLSQGDLQSRVEATVRAMQKAVPVIYKPVIRTWLLIDDQDWETWAEPDFLILEEDGYVLRHCRSGKKITRDGHPDAYVGIQFHGWLFQEIFHLPPVRLEVFNSVGKIVTIPPADPEQMREFITTLTRLKQAKEEPYSPVSWTKCQNCNFHDHCWAKAEAEGDVSLIPNIEASLILALREAGHTQVKSLLEHHTPTSLAAFEWQDGAFPRPVGETKARHILGMAESLTHQRPVLLSRPELPQTKYWAMFDLEGIPAQAGHQDKVYLWGIYLTGDAHENMQTISPDLSRQSDKENWELFLENCAHIFDTYGDVPFIHWGTFEPLSIQRYIKRYGDRSHVGRRVLRNLLDFFVLLKQAVVVPLPSYSLKVIEQYVGYERPDKEFSGYWSVVNYMKAATMKNETRRNEIMRQLLAYNEADLLAMWAVVQWLQRLLIEMPAENDGMPHHVAIEALAPEAPETDLAHSAAQPDVYP